MNRKTGATCGVLAALAGLSVGAGIAEDFEISRWTIDGGGVMFSSGGEFELSGTIGQPDAGTMTGGDGEFELTGGFWFQEPPCDCNSTGNVNLFDYADLRACLTGPEGGSLPPACRCFDRDRDGDVDLIDTAVLQRTFTDG